RIERIVREGPLGGNRSDIFHIVVGHYLGCGWSVDRIHEHLQQFPNGIADKYIGEGRLRREIDRSARKYAERVLPQLGGWTAHKITELPQPPPPEMDPPEPESSDPELEDNDEPEHEPEPAPQRPDPE